jgi:hypothetical protein
MSPEHWDELITPANPGAGATLTVLVPGHTFQRFLSVRFTLTASVAVANRVPFVAYTNGDGLEYYRAIGGAPITAGLTVICTFSPDLDTNAQVAAGAIEGPLLPEALPPGYHLVVGATALDAADQVSGVALWTRRHPTGPMEPAGGAHDWPENWASLR